ncbi:hypothetical protein K0U27_04425 [archaeon]|nr:hypothetical protein [archaeon]
MYFYYTTEKIEKQPEIKQRDDGFDDKTLVIVSAYDEDNDVLKPTFDAVKKSFTGPILLAVDSPKNVRSYIELCKRNNLICIHRVDRSGFKAGAINNVLLNFLGNQHEYIKKTKRNISDEIVYSVNKYDGSIFEMHDSLQSLDDTLSIIDNALNSSRNDLDDNSISTIASENQTNLHPKNIASLRFNIERLRGKINDIISYHDRYHAELFTLDKVIKTINHRLLRLSPDIDSLEKDVGDTIDKMTSMRVYENISNSKPESSPLKKLKIIHSKIDALENNLIKSESHERSPDVTLHNMIKSNRAKFDKIDGAINSLYDECLYHHIEQLASNRKSNFLQPNLEIISSDMEVLQKDLNDFHKLMQSLSVTAIIPDLKTDVDKIISYSNPQLSTNDIRHNDHIKDLVAEFDYVLNTLTDHLPLDIENIILLDSDAHPKSDPNPQNNFFDLCAHYIKENELVVFPQFYDQTAGNMARAAYAQQVPFMKTIMPKRGKDNTAFMLGTNIMVKKNTLEGVNGFDESTVTEDLATTIKIHESNSKSKYVNSDAVVNGAPLSIKGYFAQQQRWAYGTFQVFFKMLFHGIGKDLSLKKYVEYVYGNTWYFYGLAFLINGLIPFYSLFWDGLIEIPERFFFILYLPYVFTGIIIFVYSVLRTKHGFMDVYYNMSLNAFCFYIYIKSLFLVLSGKKIPFEVTPKSGSSEELIARYKKITPVLIVIGLLGFAVVGHTMKILSGDTALVSGSINVMWSLFFMSLLLPILRFK